MNEQGYNPGADTEKTRIRPNIVNNSTLASEVANRDARVNHGAVVASTLSVRAQNEATEQESYGGDGGTYYGPDDTRAFGKKN